MRTPSFVGFVPLLLFYVVGCGPVNELLNERSCSRGSVLDCVEDIAYDGQRIYDRLSDGARQVRRDMPHQQCVAVYNNVPGARVAAVRYTSRGMVGYGNQRPQLVSYQQVSRASVDRGFLSESRRQTADIALHVYLRGAREAVVLHFPAAVSDRRRDHNGCYLYYVHAKAGYLEWYWPQVAPDQPSRLNMQ